MAGGYQILDFENKYLSQSSSITVDGIYNKIDTIFRTNPKPFLLYNLNYDGNSCSPVFISFTRLYNGNYYFYVGSIVTGGNVHVILEITNDDKITVNQ